MTKDCSLNYRFSTSKIHVQNMLCTQIVFHFCFDIQNNWCTQHVLPMFSELVVFMYWTSESMNNLLSYCGLVDQRISASCNDLPVLNAAVWTEKINTKKLIFSPSIQSSQQNFQAKSGVTQNLWIRKVLQKSFFHIVLKVSLSLSLSHTLFLSSTCQLARLELGWYYLES